MSVCFTASKKIRAGIEPARCNQKTIVPQGVALGHSIARLRRFELWPAGERLKSLPHPLPQVASDYFTMKLAS
jgi:hypothetical protein